MKKIATAAVAAISLGLVGAAFADVAAQSGVYIGANAGWSFASSPTNSNMAQSRLGGTPTVKNKNYVFGATLGYDYAFTSNWLMGAEMGYQTFGKTAYDFPNGTDGELKNEGLQLLLTGTYLDESGFNVFGKVGAIDQKTDVSDNVGQNISFNDRSKWIPAAAVGVGYMPMQNLNVALQYEHTFGDNWNTNSDTPPSKPMTQNAVTLGVTYKFGM